MYNRCCNRKYSANSFEIYVQFEGNYELGYRGIADIEADVIPDLKYICRIYQGWCC